MSATTIADTIKTGHFSRRKKQSEVVVLAKSAIAVAAPANDANENVLATITIPAGALGANGFLDVEVAFSHTNSSNSKQMRVRLGGVSGTQLISTPATTTAASRFFVRAQNRNSQSSQAVGPTTGQIGSSSTSLFNCAIDLSTEQTLVITGQKATGSETLTLERYVVTIHYAV